MRSWSSELELWYRVILNAPTHVWSVVLKLAVAGMTTMGGFDVICDRFDADRLCLKTVNSSGKFIYLFTWWMFDAVALLVAHTVCVWRPVETFSLYN